MDLFIDNIVDWMGFNLFLAFIPLVISLIVFNKGLWEANLIIRPFLLLLTIVFFLFLPNAPYTISDITHLVRQIKDYKFFKLDDAFIMTVLIPQYLLFIFLGFSAYVISVQKFIVFLHDSNVKTRSIIFFKCILPFFMSLGIFLGRVYRYSSWDIIVHLPTIINILVKELLNISFYMYILYFYIILIMGFEFFSLFYRSIFKNLFKQIS